MSVFIYSNTDLVFLVLNRLPLVIIRVAIEEDLVVHSSVVCKLPKPSKPRCLSFFHNQQITLLPLSKTRQDQPHTSAIVPNLARNGIIRAGTSGLDHIFSCLLWWAIKTLNFTSLLLYHSLQRV